MFRKLQNENCPVMFTAPDELYSLQPTFQPMNEDGTGNTVVVFQKMRISQISEKILDPRVIKLGKLIEDGMFIDPSQMMHVFNITDPVDLENRRNQLGENVYKYLLEHKDEIKPAEGAKVVEPEK